MNDASGSPLDFYQKRPCEAPAARQFARLLFQWRSLLLIVLPALPALATVAFLGETLRAYRTNEMIRKLRANQDVAVSVNAPSELLLAKVSFLLDHGLPDEVQPYIGALDRQGNGRFAALAHYNLANSRLRQAFDLISGGKLDSAGPFVVLSREEYRRALTLMPDGWDMKFNLDVASRLIRDFPAFERTSGEALKEDRRKIWTDIPGKPEGLP